MPPRYAYWTILVDNQPTAFRAGAKEDLLPTFNRLKEKNPSAVMMWFQNGKLWPSRVDAQEAMLARGEMGRRGDARQGGLPAGARSAKVGGFRERHKVGPRPTAPARERSDRPERPEWKPKTQDSRPKTQDSRPTTQDSRPTTQDSRPKTSRPHDLKTSDKLDWKPKGTFTPAPKRSDRPEWKPRSEAERTFRPKTQDSRLKTSWKPKASFDRECKPDWKPKGSFDREHKPDWKPKGSFDRKPEWKPRTESGTRNPEPGIRAKRPFDRDRKPEWKPKTSRPQDLETPEKRKWIPKEEYKKSLGIEAKRDAKWRPGGEHRDPRQKYKDAKKAKWTRFKKTIRTKWETKSKKKS